MKDVDASEIVKFDRYFKSGNSIPVERAVIPAAEWRKVKEEIKIIAALAKITLDLSA